MQESLPVLSTSLAMNRCVEARPRFYCCSSQLTVAYRNTSAKQVKLKDMDIISLSLAHQTLMMLRCMNFTCGHLPMQFGLV